MYGVQTMEELLTLSIPKLRRLGFFTPYAETSGAVEWSIGGRKIAAIRVTVNLTGVPSVMLDYSHNGTPKVQEIALRWHPSNLRGNAGGYYYFVCPLTGSLCRNLYFVQGGFYGRQAFRCLYEKQTYSREQRELFRLFSASAQLETLRGQKHRKPMYRGNLTPYGRKLNRLAETQYYAEGLLTRRGNPRTRTPQ